MKPEEIKEQLHKLRVVMKCQAYDHRMLQHQVEALTKELAEAIRRQGMNPAPFLDRLEKRLIAAMMKDMEEREKVKNGLKKPG